MPTLIDEMVVRLSLDDKAYKAGQQRAGKAIDDTANKAKKRAGDIEDAGRKAAAFFSQLRRELVAIGATVALGGGLSSLIRSIVQTEAAVGRLAHSMGMSVETLSAWQSAARRTGGSMEETGGSLQGLTQEFQRFALTGQSSVLPYFRFLQVSVTDTENRIRPLNDILLDLSDRFSNMTPERATAFGRALGLDQGTINLLMQGRAAVTALLNEQKRLGLITKEDAEAGIRLSNALLDVQQAVERLARAILTELTPDLLILLGGMRDWLALNRQWLETQIVTKIREFRDYIAGIDWNRVREGAEAVWHKIEKVVEALGGWENLGKALFASWAVSKLEGIAIAIAAIGLALANPAVLAALAAWTAYYLASERFKAPETQEDLDRQFLDLSAESPLWRGIPREQQLRYPNSPASRGDNNQTWAQRNLPFLSGPPGAVPLADETMSQYQRGFLEALSHPESRGDYGIMNGGRERISNYASHPNRVGQGGTSTAAGRYQFTAETWREEAQRGGFNDFTPANQDRAAWNLASREYRKKTGRDLHADLASGGHEERIAAALAGRWPSLPGGSQSNQTQGQFRESVRRRTQGAGAAPTSGAAASIPFAEPGFVLGAAAGSARVASPLQQVSSATNVTGPITIHTNATNAAEIANSLRQELINRSYALQSNTGLV